MLEVSRIISVIEPQHGTIIKRPVNRMKAMKQLIVKCKRELSRSTRSRLKPSSRKRHNMTHSFAN